MPAYIISAYVSVHINTHARYTYIYMLHPYLHLSLPPCVVPRGQESLGGDACTCNLKQTVRCLGMIDLVEIKMSISKNISKWANVH